MDIKTTYQDQTAVVAVTGSIDALTSGEVSAHLGAQIEGGYRLLLLDLSEVEYMSSAGLRAIMEGLKASRQVGGDLRLAAAQPGVDKVLRMAGFPSIMKYFTSLEDATSSFKE